MTTDTLGGVFSHAAELAQALSDRGIDTVLATLGGPLSVDQRAQLSAIPRLRLHESEYRLEWMLDPWDDVAASGRWLLALARRERVDLVHVNGFAHAALPFQLPVVCGIHSCVSSWWRAVYAQDPPDEWHRYRAEVSRGLRTASALVAPTRAALQDVLACYGLRPHARTHVIHNGRNPRDFFPRAPEPLIFAAGRLWDPAKNLAALDTCAPKLPWPVVVAGSAQGPDGARLHSCNVELAGQLSLAATSSFLSRAAIFCAPVRYEPFGLSILEAALSECALVLGDTRSLREVWEDNAVYVNPDDPTQLGRELRALIEDAPRRRELAARARNRSLRFSSEAMGARYARLYDSLLPRRAAARMS